MGSFRLYVLYFILKGRWYTLDWCIKRAVGLVSYGCWLGNVSFIGFRVLDGIQVIDLSLLTRLGRDKHSLAVYYRLSLLLFGEAPLSIWSERDLGAVLLYIQCMRMQQSGILAPKN